MELDVLIDKTFNELTIKKFIERPNTDKYKSWNSKTWVHCECSCGETLDAPLYGVKNGYIKSCGHLKAEKAAENLAEVRKIHPNPTAIYLTHEGKTLNLAEWSKETGIPRTTIMYRRDKGMPPEKILERKSVNE